MMRFQPGGHGRGKTPFGHTALPPFPSPTTKTTGAQSAPAVFKQAAPAAAQTREDGTMNTAQRNSGTNGFSRGAAQACIIAALCLLLAASAQAAVFHVDAASTAPARRE